MPYLISKSPLSRTVYRPPVSSLLLRNHFTSGLGAPNTRHVIVTVRPSTVASLEGDSVISGASAEIKLNI